jgi:hypothetical protein
MKAHSRSQHAIRRWRMLCDVKSESPRLLSFIDWTSCPDRFEEARFDSLRSFMLLAMLAHSGVLFADDGPLGWYARGVFAPLFLLSALVGLRFPAFKSHCLMLTLAVTSLWLVLAWPNFANHLFLEWSVLLFLTLCQNDKRLGLNGLRWLVAILFFYTGLQKFVMGHYFEGQFLLVRVATSQKFRTFFEFVLPDEEVARLVEMGGLFGTGPYATSDAFLLLISNGIWIGEMGVAILLVFSRWRKLALFAGIFLVGGIELGARELVFGALFTILLLVFYSGRNALALWPAFAAVQILSVSSRLLWPDLRFN